MGNWINEKGLSSDKFWAGSGQHSHGTKIMENENLYLQKRPKKWALGIWDISGKSHGLQFKESKRRPNTEWDYVMHGSTNKWNITLCIKKFNYMMGAESRSHRSAPGRGFETGRKPRLCPEGSASGRVKSKSMWPPCPCQQLFSPFPSGPW